MRHIHLRIGHSEGKWHFNEFTNARATAVLESLDKFPWTQHLQRPNLKSDRRPESWERANAVSKQRDGVYTRTGGGGGERGGLRSVRREVTLAGDGRNDDGRGRGGHDL